MTTEVVITLFVMQQEHRVAKPACALQFICNRSQLLLLFRCVQPFVNIIKICDLGDV